MRQLIIWCVAALAACITLTTPYPLLAVVPLLLTARVRLVFERRVKVTDDELWAWLDD